MIHLDAWVWECLKGSGCLLRETAQKSDDRFKVVVTCRTFTTGRLSCVSVRYKYEKTWKTENIHPCNPKVRLKITRFVACRTARLNWYRRNGRHSFPPPSNERVFSYAFCLFTIVTMTLPPNVLYNLRSTGTCWDISFSSFRFDCWPVRETFSMHEDAKKCFYECTMLSLLSSWSMCILPWLRINILAEGDCKHKDAASWTTSTRSLCQQTCLQATRSFMPILFKIRWERGKLEYCTKSVVDSDWDMQCACCNIFNG